MSSSTGNAPSSSIKPIDKLSVHRITSGQVVIDLQTAIKELVENSLDAGATNLGKLRLFPAYVLYVLNNMCIEVRFKQYGLTSIEIIDNGSGIAEEDHDSIGEYLFFF
jgi:DNA mismatch repair protein PMS2